MADSASLSSKYRISIPKPVRERTGWRTGQRFAFIAGIHGIVIVPVPKREEFAGMARGANPNGYRDRTDRE